MVIERNTCGSILSTRHLAKYSIILLIIIGVIAYILRINDPAFEGVESFLFNDEEIFSYVGNLENYRVMNTRYVPGENDTNRYHEYRIILEGTNGAATLKIRADYIKDRSIWRYSVIRKYDG